MRIGDLISEADVEVISTSLSSDRKSSKPAGLGEPSVSANTLVSEGKRKPISSVSDVSSTDLWKVYKTSSTVRPCVDAITKTVSTLPWAVRSSTGLRTKAQRYATDFLRDPNVNQESFRGLLAKAVTDLMVFDVMAIEKVSNPFGKLVEIVARPGWSITPKRDKHGIDHGYIQQWKGEQISFKIDEMMYQVLHPRAGYWQGLPIIQTVVDEVEALLLATQGVADMMDQDEIPPGILALGAVGEITQQRMEEDNREDRGRMKNALRLRVLKNVSDPKWVQFKQGNRDEQVAELLEMVSRIVYRNFGVTPLEMGVTADINKSTATVELKVSAHRAINPICELFSYSFTIEFLPYLVPNEELYFKLFPETWDDFDKRALGIERYVNAGVLSTDEARWFLDQEFFWEGGLTQQGDTERFLDLADFADTEIDRGKGEYKLGPFTLTKKRISQIQPGEATAPHRNGRYSGCSVGRTDEGYCVFTHRARSKFYPSPTDIPQRAIKWIASTG